MLVAGVISGLLNIGSGAFKVLAIAQIKDFQKINYSINNNDNHLKGG